MTKTTAKPTMSKAELCRRMKQAGLDRFTLAAKIHVDPVTVWRWMEGHSGIRPVSVVALRQALATTSK